MQFEYIDLFAGCGGLSLGLHNSGWKGLFAVEKNEDAFSTLHYNLINKTNSFNWPNWLEIRNHDINDIIKNYKEQLSGLNGKVTLVTGGPPCQGFSTAGKREPDDLRNHLSKRYIKFIRIIRPEAVIFENVYGFTLGFKENGKSDKPFSTKIINSLKRMGYKVKSELIDVSQFGVPQKRKRFILVALLNHNPMQFFEILRNNLDSFLLEKRLYYPITVSDAIGDLERAHGTISSPDSPRFKAGIYGKINSNYQKYMRENMASDVHAPDSHRFANQKDFTVELYKKIMILSVDSKKVTPGHKAVKGLKKRSVTPLKCNSICNTITSIPDDYIHYSEPRILTVRETARFQSFPDWFEFKGKYTTGGERRKYEVPRYTQVANAVPPLFAEQIGLALKEVLNSG